MSGSGSSPSPRSTGQSLRGAAAPLLAAVAAAALSGTAWLIADALLLGALQILAIVLLGIAAALLIAALLAAIPPGPRPAWLLALRWSLPVLVALAVIAALLVPAWLATRHGGLSGASDHLQQSPPPGAVAGMSADASTFVISYPESGGELAGAVSAIRGTDGPFPPEELAGAVLVTSADGRFVLTVRSEGTGVLELVDRNVGRSLTEPLTGVPIAVDDGMIIMRSCSSEGSCQLSGHAWDGDTHEPRWTVPEPDGAWYAQPDSTVLDPHADPAVLPAAPAAPSTEEEGSLGGSRDPHARILPAHAVLHDPAQGLVELDPMTGFPVGKTMSTPEQTCRAAVSDISAMTEPPYHQGPPDGAVVLTLCQEEGGSVTAAAWDRGELIWQSEPGPEGQWTGLADHGRVLLAGREDGAAEDGELLAGRAGPWQAPGGGMDASAITARVAIDGRTMSVIVGQDVLMGLDTASGAQRWAVPVQGEVQGAFSGHGTLAIVDEAQRTHPLHPRPGGVRLRVIETGTGRVTAETTMAEMPAQVIPAPHGQAAVTVDGSTGILGPSSRG